MNVSVNDVVSNVINSIMEEFSQTSTYQPMRHKLYRKYDSKKALDYVHNMFQTIGMMSTRSWLKTINRRSERLFREYRWKKIEEEPTHVPTLNEIVYHLVFGGDMNSMCTGNILIRYDKILTYTQGGFRIDSPKFRTFCKEFLKRLKEGCKFNSLELSIFNPHGHANVLFTYRTESGKIYLALYEPGGSKKHRFHLNVDKIMNGIVQSAPDVFVLLPRYEVSCPIGMQERSERHKGGYCIIYSLFWMYCLLSVIKELDRLGINVELTRSKKDLSSLIGSIEPSIFSTARGKDPELLFNTVMNFAIKVINTYFETTNLTRNPKAYEEFNQIAESQFDEVYFNDFDEENEEESEVNRVDDDKMKWRTTRTKRQIEKTGIDESKRKEDGLECERDDDCLSDYCNDGVCQPYD